MSTGLSESSYEYVTIEPIHVQKFVHVRIHTSPTSHHSSSRKNRKRPPRTAYRTIKSNTRASGAKPNARLKSEIGFGLNRFTHKRTHTPTPMHYVHHTSNRNGTEKYAASAYRQTHSLRVRHTNAKCFANRKGFRTRRSAKSGHTTLSYVFWRATRIELVR